MSDEDPEQPDPRFVGLHIGTVVSRDDPEGLARVRVRIPGLIEEHSAWAWPMGIGGGSRNIGIHFVPEVGAEVAVFFHLGDVDHPYYLAAQWGAPGGVSEIPVPATDHGPDLRVVASKRWRIVMDDREGQEVLRMEDKEGGCRVEIDGVTQRARVFGVVSLVLDSVGTVEIRGLAVTINGRPVSPVGGPI